MTRGVENARSLVVSVGEVPPDDRPAKVIENTAAKPTALLGTTNTST
jgi:uncharacterized membrane protein